MLVHSRTRRRVFCNFPCVAAQERAKTQNTRTRRRVFGNFPCVAARQPAEHRTQRTRRKVFGSFLCVTAQERAKHRTPGHDAKFSADFPASQHDKAEELANRNTEKRSNGHKRKDNPQTFRLLRKVSVYLGGVRNEGTGR